MIRHLLDHAASRGMGRMLAVVLPALMVVSALIGVLVVPAVVLALVLGVVAVHVTAERVVSTGKRALRDEAWGGGGVTSAGMG